MLLDNLLEIGEHKVESFLKSMNHNDKLNGLIDKTSLCAKILQEKVAKNSKIVLSLLNIPSQEDVEKLEKKLADIENVFSNIQNKLDRMKS